MDRNELNAKLLALNNYVVRWLEMNGESYRPSAVEDIFPRFATLRDQLKSDYPELFGDLPIREEPKPERGVYWRSSLERISLDLRYCLEVLSSVSRGQAPQIAVAREGVFLAGQYYDALRHVSGLVRQATQSLILVDGYLDENVLDLFSSKQAGVNVRLLTRAIPQALLVQAQAFNKQYGNLEIRTSTSFHDRFLIIDDTDFYHFGASIKDLGHRGFMFSKIEEPQVVGLLRTGFENEWKQASVAV